jgi:mono/diheme cytochrome c family protein
MTSVHVRRTSLALLVIFAGAAGVYGALGRRAAPAGVTPPAGVTAPPIAAADAAAGARAFADRCAACHEADALGKTIASAPDRNAALAAISTLLSTGHGSATPDEARVILAHLRDRAGR